jgi:type I site-specific restriction endonuclease
MHHYARITQQHLAKRAEEEAAQVLKDAQNVENGKIVDGILAENARKAEVEALQMRELQNRNLEEDLRRQFMDSNPAATESSWLMAKSQIKQDYFVERFNAEKSREQIEQEKYAAYRM